ncbi:MAG TPA: phosphatase [Micrococcales bacterium]|uniref:PHP domain-containing protein n=1 Tax=Miniimonas arenae TaxID=676201 RepID=UPI000EC0CD26|nr:PHP domain-containing protein [Miniimonas arenae]HCX85421.1 phosphatase [Micrococcales bacterium]
MRLDLHTHSTCSDGTLSPAALVRAASEAGLDGVALTDHDTTAGWAEATEAALAVGIALVRGAEVSCQDGALGVHLLSYLHDPEDAPLRDSMAAARTSREHRARRMTELIGRDYPLTWADVVAHTPPGATVGRPHIADALVANGVATHRDALFATILANDGPYDIPYQAPTSLEAVRLVLAAGGVPVLAHPAAGRRGATLTEEEIAGLADAGLVGLEVDHRDHTPQQRRRMRDLARSLGLLVTGASDFHGTGKKNELGENLTSPEVLAQIEALGRTAVVR